VKPVHLVLASVFVAGLAMTSQLAGAAEAPLPPLIAGYGEVTPVANASERPDPALDYKVVLNATKGGGDDAPPPFLDKAAKVANLLAQSGVPAEHRHVVVILQSAATPAVLNAAGLKARGKTHNPSADLIAKLNAAGVSVRVCGQALAGAGIARSEVLPGVQVDLSALTTVSTLQLKGYALLVD
jgi:intracellular sulfur oxidation DsrE/DsrF family protein